MIPNPQKDKDLAVTKETAELLISCGGKVYIPDKYDVSGTTGFSAFPKDAEAILVIGGDGSILDASVLAIENNVPILGINLGTIGYLSEVEPTALSELEKLFRGEYTVKSELLLAVSVNHKTGTEICPRLALNDVIVSHGSPVGIGNITLRDSHGECVNYRADGLIISTPIGSTAYSLSAGGPIVAHGLETVAVTPVCAHSFFNRSIIFSAAEAPEILNSGSSVLHISIDGREAEILHPGEECRVYRSEKSLQVITFSENRMFRNLFRKMKLFENL